MNAVYLDLAALFELILALFWYDMISICIFKCGKGSHLTNVVHICQERKKKPTCFVVFPIQMLTVEAPSSDRQLGGVISAASATVNGGSSFMAACASCLLPRV